MMPTRPPLSRFLTTRAKFLFSIALLGGLVATLAYFGVLSWLQDLLKESVRWMAHLGIWAPVLFIALYIVACVVLIPGAVLTLAGGAAFGFFWGAIYVIVGATLGATAAFLVGRHFVRDWVATRFGTNPMFAAIDRATSREGWKIVFLTRLAPVFPFFLMNYAYSVTRVPLKHYFLATWIGIVPGTLLFAYVGSLANTSDQGTGSARWIWRGFVLVTAILATAYLGRMARRALSERIPIEPGLSRSEEKQQGSTAS